MGPMDLVAYCGGYCGKCDICESNVVFGVHLIQGINAEFGPSKAAAGLGWPPMRHLAQTATGMFDAAADSLTRFTEDTFPKGCRDGCVPPCEIAACARERDYLTCADCDVMTTCTKLDRHREAVAENLTFIKTYGIERFREEQAHQVEDVRRARIEAAIRSAMEGAGFGGKEQR